MYLRRAGYAVRTATTGQAALAEIDAQLPALIILDLMLPGVDGWAITRHVRERGGAPGGVPIIMLTARSQETDKIRGLDAGADDYVTKPFSAGELVARLRAILRRAARVPEQVERFTLGPAEIDLSAHVVLKDGDKAELSFYEVELLRLLRDRAGQPVSREDILQKIWGLDATPTNRTVDNFIVKLRKKIEAYPDKPAHILTVYGFGYKLVPS